MLDNSGGSRFCEYGEFIDILGWRGQVFQGLLGHFHQYLCVLGSWFCGKNRGPEGQALDSFLVKSPQRDSLLPLLHDVLLKIKEIMDIQVF